MPLHGGQVRPVIDSRGRSRERDTNDTEKCVIKQQRVNEESHASCFRWKIWLRNAIKCEYSYSPFRKTTSVCTFLVVTVAVKLHRSKAASEEAIYFRAVIMESMMAVKVGPIWGLCGRPNVFSYSGYGREQESSPGSLSIVVWRASCFGYTQSLETSNIELRPLYLAISFNQSDTTHR